MEWTVGPAHRGLRLDKFLAAPGRLGSRGHASEALKRGKVFVNGTESPAADGARRVGEGDVVRVWIDRPGSGRARGPIRSGDLQIVYEDDALVVIDKPPGLLVVPLEGRADVASVHDQLRSHLRSHGKRRPLVVHRIDRDTSGLVVFAKSMLARDRLRAQFKRHAVERVYRAVVHGHPDPSAGTWRDRLAWDPKALVQKAARPDDRRGREALSHYRVLERFTNAALIEVQLVTGKQNQIRIQARLRSHTLVGERKYVADSDDRALIPFGRQALHAFRLGFEHPGDGRPLRFEAPMPADLLALLARLARPQKSG